MKFRKYLNENDVDWSQAEKIKKTFLNIPNGSPESIAKYLVNVLRIVGVQHKNNNMTYLSGPMTNLPDFNWPTFIYAEKYIKGKVFNPAHPHGSIIKKPKNEFKWADFMIEDVYGLLQCNKITLLPGYSNSTGAKTEVKIGESFLKTKAIELKKDIGLNNYLNFVDDVKNKYYNDGNKDGYDKIIGPMLLAKSEVEAAKKVKSWTPKQDESIIIDEGVIDSIKDFMNIIKSKSLKNVLNLIGIIFDKSGVKKIKR